MTRIYIKNQFPWNIFKESKNSNDFRNTIRVDFRVEKDG